MAQSKLLSNIKTLRIAHCGLRNLPESGLKIAISNNTSRLEVVDILANPIGEEGLKEVISIFDSIPRIQSMCGVKPGTNAANFSKRNLQPIDIKIIAHELKSDRSMAKVAEVDMLENCGDMLENCGIGEPRDIDYAAKENAKKIAEGKHKSGREKLNRLVERSLGRDGCKEDQEGNQEHELRPSVTEHANFSHFTALFEALKLPKSLVKRLSLDQDVISKLESDGTFKMRNVGLLEYIVRTFDLN